MSDELNKKTAASAPRPWRFYACAAGLALLAVLLYGSSVSHPFIWDDTSLITSMRGVAGQESITNVLLPGFSQRVFDRQTGFYRPLTSLSLALDYALWGKNPAGYHATNIILYALCVLLLTLFIRRLTRLESPALLAGVLFLVHAAHAEAVLWVKCRAEMLAFLAFIGSLWCFLNSRHNNTGHSYRLIGLAASVILYLLAMGSKTHTVVLPAMACLILLWDESGGKKAWMKLVHTWPLWTAGILYSILIYTIADRNIVKAGYNLEVDELAPFSPIQRITASILAYLRMTFWPHELKVIHAASWLPSTLISLGILFLLVSLWMLLILYRKRFGWLALGTFWYSIALMPLINIIPIDGRWVAEQRLFLPSAGICMVLGMIILKIPGWCGVANRLSQRIIITGTLCAFCAIHLIPVFGNLPHWRSEEAFWREILRYEPEYVTAYDWLGVELATHGRQEEGLVFLEKARHLAPEDEYISLHYGIGLHLNNKSSEAIAVLQEVVQKRPDLGEAHVSLAHAYLGTGRIEEASASATRALELYPQLEEAEIVLIRCHSAKTALGEAQAALKAGESGDYNKAILHWKAALVGQPRADWHSELGRCLLLSGQTDEAISEFNKSIAMAPEEAVYHANLAEALLSADQKVAAASRYREALRLDPRDGASWGGLGVCLAQQGDLPAALDALSRAVELEPRNPDLWRNHGFALLQARQIEPAVAAFRKSIDLKPDAALSWQLLARAYVAAGSQEMAAKADARAKELENSQRSVIH